MPRFMRFAEEAIEKAGRVGLQKRKKAREHELQIQARGHEQEVRLADIAAATAAQERTGIAEQKRLSWIRGTGPLGVAKERERGALERRGLTERGLEERHLRRFGPEGTEIKTAGMKLSDVMRERKEERAGDIYKVEEEMILTPLLIGEGEEMVLPTEINALRLKAKTAETRTPGSGIGILQKGIKEYEEDKLFSESLIDMPLKEMEALRTQPRLRLGGF